MKIIFEKNIKEYKQMPSSNDVIQAINEMIQDDYYFSHMVIDGVEVYEEPENYLFEDEIQVIEVKVRTKEQFLVDVLIAAIEYCQRAGSMLPVLVRSFSSTPYDSDWQQFSHMLEGIEWLHQMIQLVDRAKGRQHTNELVIIGAHLEVLTNKLLKAFENHDYLLISRYIQKELLPVYETLETEISGMLVAEQYGSFTSFKKG